MHLTDNFGLTAGEVNLFALNCAFHLPACVISSLGVLPYSSIGLSSPTGGLQACRNIGYRLNLDSDAVPPLSCVGTLSKVT